MAEKYSHAMMNLGGSLMYRGALLQTNSLLETKMALSLASKRSSKQKFQTTTQ